MTLGLDHCRRLLLGLAVVVSFSGPARAFDLAIPTNAEALKILSTKLANQSDEAILRDVHRLGNKTIEVESYLSTDCDRQTADAVLSDFAHYRNWALVGLNHRRAGGDYYLKIHDLAPKPGDPSVLVANLSFDLPLFKTALLYLVRVHSKQEKDVLTITAESLPQPESPIKSAEAFAKIFPAPRKADWCWIYIKSRSVINNWLLYEALPEQVLQRETGDRLQIIVDNYHHEESRLHPLGEESTPSTAKKMKAPQPAKRVERIQRTAAGRK